jgi:hypothetical protein
MSDLTLTEDQKKFIIKNFETVQNLNDLTRACFNNPNIDGRCKEGRAIRNFLVENNLSYVTTKRKLAENVILTDEQKATIDKYYKDTKTLEICKILWQNEEITPLSKKFLVVAEYIKVKDPYLYISKDEPDKEYSAPSTINQLIKCVTSATCQQFDDKSLTENEKEQFDKLRIYMHSPRFMDTMNSYSSISDRRLLEAEYVRTVWDKMDLNFDEINICVDLCSDYIRQSKTEKELNALREQFSNAINDGEKGQALTVKLTEMIKAKNDELNAYITRRGKMNKDLNGSRGERNKQKVDRNASFLSLVKAFMKKDEREKMIKISLAQKKSVENEVDRLESMSELKARIIGLEKQDAV